MPRILKINWIKDLSISVVFNNGESRIIDFRKVLNKISLVENSPARILYDSKEFEKVELENNTLSWNNVEQYITMRNKEKMKVPYQIGADVLLKHSRPEISELALKSWTINQRIKNVIRVNSTGVNEWNFKNIYFPN